MPISCSSVGASGTSANQTVWSVARKRSESVVLPTRIRLSVIVSANRWGTVDVGSRTSRGLAQASSLDHAHPDHGGVRQHRDAQTLEPDVRPTRVVEEPRAVTEEYRGDNCQHLVELPGLETLAGDVSTQDVDVAVPAADLAAARPLSRSLATVTPGTAVRGR